MRTVLETPRMRLREFTPEDAHLLVELDSDPEVMRYITGGAATPPEVVLERVLPRILDHYRSYPGFGCWAAHDRHTGEFLGWFSLRYDAESPVPAAELGYRLRRAAWGRGLATEGALALVDRGFGELGFERVFATAYGENLASMRVMEKAGLRFARRFRLTFADLVAQGLPATEDSLWDGDDVEYALDRPAWQAARPSPAAPPPRAT